jgi:aminopeptidase
MTDPRIQMLADQLVGFSMAVKKGDNVLIDLYDVPDSIGVSLIRAVREAGGTPFLQVNRQRLLREMNRGVSDTQAALQAELELHRIQRMDCYVGIRGAENIFEGSDVPPADLKRLSTRLKPAWDHRVQKTRWVVLRWPTSSMAQQAQMSTEAFEDFYFKVCTLDYARMQPGMAALKKVMEKTDRVEIRGPGTDLRFSIKGIGAVTCGGRRNIPDGEVFTAPVRDSVEGEITYNTPSVYQGTSFDNVRLKFRKGKIVEATSSNSKRLQQILDTDEGARFIGEFAIGFNPHIQHPMRDILFDEKIAGSIHMALGQAYEDADNTNRSAIHWDLVQIMRPEYGGGEILFDGKVIRKDGIFTVPELKGLNPDAYGNK